MKYALVLSLLAMIVAIHAQSTGVCDPDGNNEPTCTAANAGQTYRNFYDPVHYWQCPPGGGAALKVSCPTEHLYDAATSTCITWWTWSWTPNCPVAAA